LQLQPAADLLAFRVVSIALQIPAIVPDKRLIARKGPLPATDTDVQRHVATHEKNLRSAHAETRLHTVTMLQRLNRSRPLAIRVRPKPTVYYHRGCCMRCAKFNAAQTP
jgi:hypothetical protein